ncbi:MAG: hypothetical protein RI907_3661 [Pseudomonadota bacterium]|jgi:uncharacterized membrane protein YfcA
MDVSALQLGVMVTASAAAGLIDAIVGGGGLIILPALFALFPSAMPATLLGTNKSAAVWGTGWSAWQYARRVKLPEARLAVATALAAAGSLTGAWLATRVPSAQFRMALPIVLSLVWLYTWWRKDLGQAHAPHLSPMAEGLGAAGLGATIGLYDGVFGPGTGSFFIFGLVRLLGWGFVHASAAAKRLNFATNVAALSVFIPQGHVIWPLVLPMAVANVAGSTVGTRLALRLGTGFVRLAFLAVVGALVAKTAWDTWLR